MSLRINQNIAALFSYSNLTNSSNDLEKSISKLGSGLRITRASDDAAGLAISEKMRRQSRGLTRAILNAQDGISMIQTAEGALVESQGIIQRMRELALQSANDTLTTEDRLKIQQEVDALKGQIDSIANSTKFNTKKLLNGNQAALVSSSSNSIFGIVGGNANVSGDYDVSLVTVKGGVSQIQRSQIFTDRNTGELASGTTYLKDIDQFYNENGVFALETTQTVTLSGNRNSASIVLDGKMTLNEVAAQLQQAVASSSGLGIENSKCSLVSENATGQVGDGGYLQIISGVTGENGDFTIAASQSVIDALGFSVTRESENNMIDANIRDAYGNSKSVTTSNNRAVGLLDGIDIAFTSSPAQIAGNGGIIDGLSVGPGNENFTIEFDNLGTPVSLEISVVSGNWSLEGIARSINEQLENNPTASPLADLGFSATVSDGEIKLEFVPTEVGQDSSFSISNATADNSFGMLVGDYNGFVIGQKDESDVIRGISKYYTANETIDLIVSNDSGLAGYPLTLFNTVTSKQSADLQEINEMLEGCNSYLSNKKMRVDEVNGSLVFSSTVIGNRIAAGGSSDDYLLVSMGSITVSSKKAMKALGLALNDYNSELVSYGSGDSICHIHVVDTKPQFQIGADEGENMKIAIGSMTCRALELERIDISSVESAEKSLEKLNQALDRISHQRAQLGSYQNRLEYTIANLQNTNTNTVEAESRIRDVDVASEMTKYAKNQILAQAGTSMLAQANALPQNALSLLQAL